MVFPGRPVRTALWAAAHGASWVRWALGSLASQLLKASAETQALLEVALSELLEVEAGPGVALTLAAPEQPEGAVGPEEEAPELAGAPDAREERPEQVEPTEVALPPPEEPVLQAGPERAVRRGESHAGFPLEVGRLSRLEVDFRAPHPAERASESWPPEV